MVHLPIAIDEEIALEGLDGITLESFWFRMSERLELPLPFYDHYKAGLWNLILRRDHFEYFEIEASRKTVGRLNRIEFVNNDGKAVEEVNNSYHIYSYNSVDDPFVRGSCKEFKTRKKLEKEELKSKKFEEIVALYDNRLVIVASQKLRNTVLIPANIGRECDINNHAYCMLERIGRSRYFGETTSGPFSMHDFVKDSKLLHYFRSCLLKNNLVFRQQIVNRVNGKSVVTQLFHSPRYYVVVRSTDVLQVEKLFTYLQTKENNIAALDEVKSYLKIINQKSFANMVKTRNEIFEYRKFPYRDIHPNAEKKVYASKNGNEKQVLAIKLLDKNLDIFQLYENDDKDLPLEDDSGGFLDNSNQKIKIPLIYQVVDEITKTGNRGMSQSEIGKYFGLSKLNSRAVLRKAQKMGVTTFMKDFGRQRVSMFISTKYSNEKSQKLVSQVEKLFKKAEETTNLPPFKLRPLEEAPKLEPLSTIPENPSSTKVSIPLNFLKQELSSAANVIQYVPHQSCIEDEPKENIQPFDDSNRIVLKNNDYSFVDNVENVEVSLRFLNNIPGMQKQPLGLQEDLAKNRVSEKVLSRMNIILDAIKENTVMDCVNLLMTVRKIETSLLEVICRKSLLFLCARLAVDNFIKVIEMELTSPTKTVKLLFFGEPNITFDLRCWHSIIEEQKIQHFISMNRTKLDPVEIEAVPLAPVASFYSATSIVNDELSAQSTNYENFPKFMKYRLFHEFLFYLIYNYPADVERIQVKRAVDIWRRENQRLTDYDEIAEKISICYSTDISWKMFIPPLNPQIGYDENGWGLLRDIIHRIPLILYVKFTRYANLANEINEYLAHPIKSNYLLYFLPPKMFAELTQGRKHVSVISELCKRLAMMGLLQFGPMRTKELDQTFIYLNRNAMMLDTRSSEPGYLEVSEKDYTRLKFHFESTDNVANYWSSLFEICINTRINLKSIAIGQTIILEPLNAKADLLNALKPQLPSTAPSNDVGVVPGDRKGAGGLDKAFMSHLKQSWSRSIDRKKRPISALSVQPKAKATRKEKVKVEPKKKKKSVAKPKVVLQSNFKGVSSKSKIIRHVKPKKQTVKELKKRSELYDEVDKEALRGMKTLRVNWSDVEDKTLLLAKVALKFAFPSDNQCAHYINFGLIRDILYWRTEKAANKTSRACQRRIFYLMKNNKNFRDQTTLYLEELRANREFSNKYSCFAERLKKLYNQEEIYLVVKVHMTEMIHRMHQIFFKQYLSSQMNIDGCCDEIFMELPRNFDDLLKAYKILNPNKCLDEARYQEPINSNDIEISILSSLIHGAVCSTNDKISNTFFLHETYSKFSDDNLGSAVNLLRRLTIISLNKNQKSKKPIMPRTISPFHLSNRYASQLQGVHIPVELYDEYLSAMRDISAVKDSYQMKTINCGWIFMIAEFLNRNLMSLRTERVDQPFMLDGPSRRKTCFEKISENYLLMKKQQAQGGDKKKIKSVRFDADSNSDEKFIYNEDPIEIFCKLDVIYLHLFCILQAMDHDEKIGIDEWTLLEDDKCTLKNCLLRSGNNFCIEVQKIACHGYEIIKYILHNSDQGPSKYDETLITKFNLVKFFDSIIKRHQDGQNMLVRSGKVDSRLCQKISTTILLESIQRIATEVESDDGAWLIEYKKISLRKTDDDEVFYDEDDSEQSRMLKMTSPMKDTSVNKISDSFVVNLSSLQIGVDRKDGTEVIDGDSYRKKFVPFDEATRLGMIEAIKMKHVWMPEDFAKMSLKDALIKANIGISKTIQKQLEKIGEFLKKKNKMGAKVDEMLDKFGNKSELYENMEMLLKIKFVLLTGVNEMRFVHKEFAAFWLVDTFYLTAKDSDEILAPPVKKMKRDSCSQNTDTEDTPMDIDYQITKEEPKSAVAENDEAEKDYKRNPFFLLPCPWIRVGSLNRTLNRRCFDKWLGTVLNYLSVNSGIMLTDLCAKFNVLTPVHVRNLCDVLQVIGCVRVMAFEELNVNIFSDFDSQNEESKPATYLDTFNRTYIEVSPDALLRLAFFIGKKKYKFPFI